MRAAITAAVAAVPPPPLLAHAIILGGLETHAEDLNIET